MDKKKTKVRKCTVCKEGIELIDGPDTNFFYEIKNNGLVATHSECYIQYHTQKKRARKTKDECLTYINEQKKKYEDGSMERQIEITNNNNPKRMLTDFIFEMYDITFLPKQFYIKMETIYKGTYKSINKPIPPEDLLDMWKKRRTYLNGVHERNRKMGKDMDATGRIYYDLAILLSKYDSYLKWKENKKIELTELENQKDMKANAISYCDVVGVSIPKKEKHEGSININSILDEI